MRGSLRALVGAVASLVVVQGLGLLNPTTADAAAGFQLRSSASTNRTSPRVLQGAVVAGAAYIFVTPTAHVARVAFWVDDPHRLRTPRHIDSHAPFDLVSGSASKANPWWTSGLKEGTHHLTAQITTTGGKHVLLQSVFTVRNTPKAPVTPRTVPGSSRVTVIWHSAGGTTKGFNVYRGTSTPVSRTHPLNGSKLLDAGRTSFVDRTVDNGTRYFYVVAAVSAHGLLSKPSPTVSARPLASAPAAPPPPEQINATAGAGQITVDWQSGGGSTDGFNVYRWTSANVPLTNPRNSSPIGAATTTYVDAVSNPGKYYYVVQAVSATGIRSDPSDTALATFGAAAIQLSSPKPVLYVHKSGTITGTVTVTNVGDADLTVTGETLAGNSNYLTLSSVPDFTLGGGEQKDLTLSFHPLSNGPQHATVQVVSNDPDTPNAKLAVGGLAIDSTVNGEPSLQWIIDAYGIAANDGDAHPSTYPLEATSIPPAGGILVKAFTRHDASKPIRVTALAAFVNPATAGDSTKDPQWGWTPANTSPGAPAASYTVRRDFIGTTYTINPSGTFGLWTRVEATTLWTGNNQAGAPRFIAFPVAGSPGTYVLADDTTGRTSDDWNDLPLLVENVNTIPPG